MPETPRGLEKRAAPSKIVAMKSRQVNGMSWPGLDAEEGRLEIRCGTDGIFIRGSRSSLTPSVRPATRRISLLRVAAQVNS